MRSCVIQFGFLSAFNVFWKLHTYINKQVKSDHAKLESKEFSEYQLIFWKFIEIWIKPKKISRGNKKVISLSGNWTPVSRVTGGDTYHYTNKDWWEGMGIVVKRNLWVVERAQFFFLGLQFIHQDFNDARFGWISSETGPTSLHLDSWYQMNGFMCSCTPLMA